MRYSDSQKGYVLYDLITSSFFISRDVLFREDVFLFAKIDTTVNNGVFVYSFFNCDVLMHNIVSSYFG